MQVQKEQYHISTIIKYFSADPRHYQIGFLSIFLIYGLAFLHFDLNLITIALIFFICFSTQLLFVSFASHDYGSLKSACISALSLCLMLKTGDYMVAALAAFLSITGKFVFRYKFLGNRNGYKHFFNPTNFGIIAVLLFNNYAWISPGQWGSEGLLLFFIGSLGLIVLLKVKRLDTAFAFLLAYSALQFVHTSFILGWSADVFLHQFTSGTLLLFTFFMITDPVSTPSNQRARIIWSMLIAALAFYLSAYQFVNGAPLWALFLISPFTPLFDKFFKGEKFSWRRLTHEQKTKSKPAFSFVHYKNQLS